MPYVPDTHAVSFRAPKSLYRAYRQWLDDQGLSIKDHLLPLVTQAVADGKPLDPTNKRLQFRWVLCLDDSKDEVMR